MIQHTFFSCFYSLEKTLFFFYAESRAGPRLEEAKEMNMAFPNRFRAEFYSRSHLTGWRVGIRHRLTDAIMLCASISAESALKIYNFFLDYS